MISTEAHMQNQTQQSNIYDECVFNERIRRLFDSFDSTTASSLSSNNINTTQMTSIVDALFPAEASLYQQQQCNPRHSSTNDLTSAFDRFSPWNTTTTKTNKNNDSASAYCGGTTNDSSNFANRHQTTQHSSTHSLRNNYQYNQQQQQQQKHYYRPPPVTRPRFAASTIRIPSAATM